MSKTHFGFETVDEQDKAKKVAGVFHSVASNYDLMNDLMSGGLHRVWKIFTIGQAAVRPGATKCSTSQAGRAIWRWPSPSRPAKRARSGTRISTNRCCASGVTGCSTKA